ncbi:hypothetical protein Dimus_002425 [Dionaea muscipula]
MNSLDHNQRQGLLQGIRWQETRPLISSMSVQNPLPHHPSSFYTKHLVTPHGNNPRNLQVLRGVMMDVNDDDLLSNMVPLVTVVLEGRSICQRISLHSHGSYKSLAKALRQMFVVDEAADQLPYGGGGDGDDDLDLSNAVPGHLVAYEDVENDLLLAGDLKWKDFVRVAKRLRIIPLRSSCSGKATAVACTSSSWDREGGGGQAYH